MLSEHKSSGLPLFLLGIALLMLALGCRLNGLEHQDCSTESLLEQQCIPDNPPRYLIIDLSGGPTAANYPYRFSEEPPDLSRNACRTHELWLRRIPAGTFVMGSPKDEASEYGRPRIGETRHLVTLTHGFYIGVFEITQYQWKQIMGKFPSLNAWKEADGILDDDRPNQGNDTGPVLRISYLNIRGNAKGTKWPSGGHVVDDDSFMGMLRAKTGLEFDLPTEAQWEYACRAGTSTAFNSGKGLVNEKGKDANLDELGRYRYNNVPGQDWNIAEVGSYQPNAWGLYDMHGNVSEWCLDWCDSLYTSREYFERKDPVGIDKFHYCRIVRGGGYWSESVLCRSAVKLAVDPSGHQNDLGFRIVWNVPDEIHE